MRHAPVSPIRQRSTSSSSGVGEVDSGDVVAGRRVIGYGALGATRTQVSSPKHQAAFEAHLTVSMLRPESFDTGHLHKTITLDSIADRPDETHEDPVTHR